MKRGRLQPENKRLSSPAARVIDARRRDRRVVRLSFKQAPAPLPAGKNGFNSFLLADSAVRRPPCERILLASDQTPIKRSRMHRRFAYTRIDGRRVLEAVLVADGTYIPVFIIYVIATFLYGPTNERARARARAPHHDGVSDLCLTSSNRRAYITA